MNKWDLLKCFYPAKKIKSTDWEKIFANDVTEKRLVSRIYKQLMTLNIITSSKQPTQKWAENLKETFLQRGHTDGHEAQEKMFDIANYWGNANITSIR